MKLKYKRWQAVGVWKWNVDADCSICRGAFEACCPECKFPGDDCPPVWGACKHSFHMHCLIKWLKALTDKGSREECPLCRAEWEYGAQ